MAKKYVPVFFDWMDTTIDLTQEQKGNLIDAIVDYSSGRREYDDIVRSLMPLERVAFRFMKGQVDRNDEISAVRSKAGSRKQEQTEENATSENKPKQTETKRSKNFVKPTLEEVTNYCLERKNSIDPQNFLDFYESKGWKVGNQAMKDWKACIRTWEQRAKGDGLSAVRGIGSYDHGKGSTDQRYAFLKD